MPTPQRLGTQRSYCGTDRLQPRVECGALYGIGRRARWLPAAQQHLRIEVWDTGPGIPKEYRRQIFGEFYRLPDGGSHGSLGLAIVERLCHLLEHRIELRSTVGRGSRFSVSVPTAQSQEKSAPQPTALGTIDMSLRKQVVVIDDSQIVLDGMGTLLRSWGCRVVTAETPDAALAELGAAARPDLIISDFHLTNGTGIAAIAQLRTVYGAVPAFLMVGDTAPERLREARESGHHLLYKPVQPMTLRAMMRRLVKNGDAGEPHSCAPFWPSQPKDGDGRLSPKAGAT